VGMALSMRTAAMSAAVDGVGVMPVQGGPPVERGEWFIERTAEIG